jgi:uroporphyrinogen decarboxylase
VHGVLVAEPAAGMLSPELCDLFSSAYVKRIVDAVQDERFLVILHNCGNTGVLNRSMLATGARALHFGNRNPIAATLAELPADVLVMGNLDPANVFRLGSPDRVREETRSLLAAAGKHANFVISSGCDIPPGTPRANIDAFYGAVREYNGQKASPPEFRRGRDTVPHVVPVFGMRGRHKGAIAIDRREPKD